MSLNAYMKILPKKLKSSLVVPLIERYEVQIIKLSHEKKCTAKYDKVQISQFDLTSSRVGGQFIKWISM